MSKKKLIALLVSTALVVVLLSGCAPEAEVVEKTVEKTVTETETVEVDKTYKCLNPVGEFIPVELNPLAPRLDSLDGKKILYYQSEANPVIMTPLLERLKRDHPTSTFTLVYTEAFGSSTPNEEELTHDACIRGISW